MYVKCFAVNVEGGGGSPPVWCKQIPGIDVVTPSTVKVRSTQRYITFSFTKRRVCTCARQRLVYVSRQSDAHQLRWHSLQCSWT